MSAAAMWGLRDTVDNVWMGSNETEAGPRLFNDYMLARIAAQMMDVQLGQPEGRTKAERFVLQPLRLRDSVKTKMGSARALRILEGE